MKGCIVRPVGTAMSANFPQTITEMRKMLEELEAQGHGDSEPHVMQYAGGNDEPCLMRPVAPANVGEPVMFETRFVR